MNGKAFQKEKQKSHHLNATLKWAERVRYHSALKTIFLPSSSTSSQSSTLYVVRSFSTYFLFLKRNLPPLQSSFSSSHHPIPPTQVRSCWQPHPCFSLACLSRGYGSHSLLLALVLRKLAPEHGCLSRACAELGRQVWVSLTYRWQVTDITQDRCQYKRRRIKYGERPLGRENEDKTQAGGGGHCYQWPQREGVAGGDVALVI